jgi:hypothetical protein
MYYVTTVIQKLFTPDSEMRRAERYHARQRAARKQPRDRT